MPCKKTDMKPKVMLTELQLIVKDVRDKHLLASSTNKAYATQVEKAKQFTLVQVTEERAKVVEVSGLGEDDLANNGQEPWDLDQFERDWEYLPNEYSGKSLLMYVSFKNGIEGARYPQSSKYVWQPSGIVTGCECRNFSCASILLI